MRCSGTALDDIGAGRHHERIGRTGMNQVVLMLYLSNILSRRRTPIVPAKRPREMSDVESSPW